ncbi:MAG: DNA topoisomerase [Treponema sp.]|jgi:DNA topoisomerase-3|nr:DNA topoisomerase [Treponema sp.]
MLILTEKPSVAKAFADALGVTRKDNYWENGEYCIVNALGHLLEDYSPEDYNPALKKWSLEGLPIIPERVEYKAIEKTKAQLAVVKNYFARHKNDPFLLATDAEREGELIGAEILDYVGFTGYAHARRFWVSEALTPEVIRKGIENAKPLADYKSYREQGFARQFADWLVGMNLTRLVTLKTNKLLHFGRVQTAVLAAVLERENSIANFTPENYFEIKAVLKKNSGAEEPFSVKLVNPDNQEFPTRFTKNSCLLEKVEKIKNSMKAGIITGICKEKKTVPPPQLFNLTALQKEAHKQYGYSPEETLEIAQTLYEKHKCLSYPRTPSRVMGGDNVELVRGIYEKLKTKYAKVAGTGRFNDAIANSDPSLISHDNKRVFNSADLQDHHALIPLAPLSEALSVSETSIYSLVLERFFTVLNPPYVYNSISINVDISGHKFIGKGIEVINSGWKSGSGGVDDNDEEKEPEKDYSGLEKSRVYPVSSVNTEEKQTEPKKHYTFASLLQLMENPRGDDGKHLTGLGTPATRGAILQKLVDRKYVSLKGKNVLISDNGKFLIENILKNDGLTAFISVPETTRWEEQLHNDTAAFIEGIKDFVRATVKNTGMTAYQYEKKSLGKCPLCAGDVYEGNKNYYCGNYKAENPCRFTIWKEICHASVNHSDVQALLAGKQTKVKKCTGKTGKYFNAKLELVNGKIEFRFEEKK